MKNTLCENICKRLSDYIESGELSNDDVLQIIEHVGGYLNLQTRTKWAKSNNKSYNAAKLFRRNVNIFGATFVVDNI